MSSGSPPEPSASIEAPAPKALAEALEDQMYAKATTPVGRMFLLSLTGGAFIALGFIFMVTSQQGMEDIPVGPAQVLGGVVFAVGLALVVVSGSDLFTGTTMTSMPWLSKRISTGLMIKHWVISLAGNIIGSIAVAVLVLLGGVHADNDSAWGLAALDIALGKVELDWSQAFFLGILANFAVCLAVWLAVAGQTVTDKLLAVVGPIGLFVAAGFEHSVANLFILPMGLLIRHGAGEEFWAGQAIVDAGLSPDDYEAITIGAVLWDNLTPVLLGNIIGGAIFVGLYFWLAYRRPEVKAEESSRD